jgi:hypothetical protein
MLYRDRGRLASRGSSQARALTAMTILGGKAGGPATPGLFVQPREALLEEALSPLRDDLAGYVQASCDLIVAQPLGGVEHNLGADDISIR